MYLGSQVISAARENLERAVGREVHGRLLLLYLVVGLSCYWLAELRVGKKNCKQGDRGRTHLNTQISSVYFFGSMLLGRKAKNL